MQTSRNLCRFLISCSAAMFIATALAVPNPAPTLALRDKAPELWVVEGDAVCLRYSAFNPDYKDPVPIGVYYTGLLKAKTSYKVWLVAPKQTGDCYTPAADWASFDAVK